MAQVKKTPVFQQKPVHEVDSHGRHRIITFRAGIPQRSAWFEAYEIAHFNGLLASTKEQGGIPQGIFKIAGVAHEVLQ